MKRYLTLLVLLLSLVCVPFVHADTQTINTVPGADANFMTDLQAFLEQENAERIQTGLTTRVVSGGIGATDASLAHTISTVTAYVEGYYIYDAAVSRTYTASTDTFVLLRYDGTATVTIAGAAITYDGNFVFAEMANASAQPNAPAGTMMLFEAVTDGSAITTINDYRSGGIVFLSDPRFADGSSGRLKDAVDTLSSLVVTLVVDCDDDIKANTTTPTTMTVWVLQGNVLSDNANEDLTINKFKDPGPVQCFDWDGTGSVSFGAGAVTEVYPEQWGGAGDNSTDNHTPTEKALSSSVGRAVLSSGIYLTTDSITIPSNTTLKINRGATLKLDDSATGAIKIIDASSTPISNVTILGPGTIDGNKDSTTVTKAHGIEVRGTNIYIGGGLTIKNIKDDAGSWGDGILVEFTDGTISSNITMDNLIITDTERNGIAVVDGEDINISNIILADNELCGIDLEVASQVAGNDSHVRRVNINNVVCTNTGFFGVSAINAILTGGVMSDINISNVNILNTDDHGFRVGGNSTQRVLNVNLSNINVSEGGDGGNENGMWLTYIDKLNMTNIKSEKAATNGIKIEYVNYFKGRNINVYNNGVTSTAVGFRFENCGKVDIASLTAYDGSSGTQSWGLYGVDTTHLITGSNLDLGGNTSGAIYMEGISNYIVPQQTTKIGTIAGGTDDERPIAIPFGISGAYIVEVYLINTIDIVQHDTDYETFDVQNKGGNGDGTTSFFATPPNTKATGGLTISNTDLEALGIDQNQLIDNSGAALYDPSVLTFKKTHSGSGQGLDEALVMIKYIPY